MIKDILPNWNKNTCEITNYYLTKERAEELLSKQETQIEDTCEYCLTCRKCKKYLTYSKEYKKVGFWTFNKNVKIWEIFDPDWSYKNIVFEIKQCSLWFILDILFYNKKRSFSFMTYTSLSSADNHLLMSSRPLRLQYLLKPSLLTKSCVAS